MSPELQARIKKDKVLRPVKRGWNERKLVIPWWNPPFVRLEDIPKLPLATIKP